MGKNIQPATAMKISDHCRLPGHYWVKSYSKWTIAEWIDYGPTNKSGWLAYGRFYQDENFEEIDEVMIVRRHSQDDCNCGNCGCDPGPNWVASNILDGAAKRIAELEQQLTNQFNHLAQKHDRIKELELIHDLEMEQNILLVERIEELKDENETLNNLLKQQCDTADLWLNKWKQADALLNERYQMIQELRAGPSPIYSPLVAGLIDEVDRHKAVGQELLSQNKELDAQISGLEAENDRLKACLFDVSRFYGGRLTSEMAERIASMTVQYVEGQSRPNEDNLYYYSPLTKDQQYWFGQWGKGSKDIPTWEQRPEEPQS